MVASRSTRLVIYQIRTESLGTGARPVCCCIARWMYETKKPQLARAATTHMHHRHARTVRLQPAAACMHAHTVSMHACLAQHRPAAGRQAGVTPASSLKDSRVVTRADTPLCTYVVCAHVSRVILHTYSTSVFTTVRSSLPGPGYLI